MTGALDTALVKSVDFLVDSVKISTKKFLISQYDKFVATYTNIFEEHMNQSTLQCATFKNIVYRNQHAITLEKYVPVRFEFARTYIRDSGVLNLIKDRHKVAIIGQGGSGKTLFVKWAVLQLALSIEHHQKIPLYLELKDISSASDLSEDFESYIFKRISTKKNRDSFDQFVKGLLGGNFIIVLDAADEIDKHLRFDAVKSIQKFARTYDKCAILLTSREFDPVTNIQGFNIMRTTSLEEKQSVEIINRLDYDEAVKGRFVADIPKLQKQNSRFFLENPLLITIMLLVYDRSSEIPEKRSAFYKRAFETLFERHDSSKGVYRRNHHAGLSMEDFETIFSCFCFGTYLNSRYEFSFGDLAKLFKVAIEECEIEVDPKGVAMDAWESVCLLVREGHDFFFVHRSFQEYFAAIFLKNYRGENLAELVDLSLRSRAGESVIDFLFEIDQISVDQNYVLPFINRTLREVEILRSKSFQVEFDFVSLLFRSILIGRNDLKIVSFHTRNSDTMNDYRIVGEKYPSVDIDKIFSSGKFRDEESPFRSEMHMIFDNRFTDFADVDKGEAENSFAYNYTFTEDNVDIFYMSEIPHKVNEFIQSLLELKIRIEKLIAYRGGPSQKLVNRFSV